MNKICSYLMLFSIFLVPIFLANAHNPDRSIIYIKVYETSNIEGEFHICINELNDILGMKFNDQVSLDEIRIHKNKIENYLKKTTKFESSKGVHNIVFNDNLYTIDAGFAPFISFGFTLENSVGVANNIDVTFKSFISEDPNHINYLTIEYNWKSGIINNEAMMALVFDNDNYTKTLSITDTSIWKGILMMIKQGIWHIWIGIDHILFILALILPAVVRRRETMDTVPSTGNAKFNVWSWEPVDKFKPAFMYIVKIITFFTIAHTITLSLASLQIIELPSRLVESIIALSIGLAAYHNIKPIFKGKDWLIAFIFGLFHGFGFASVLGELGVKGEHLSLSLFGFNVGVEIGQLVIIAAIFPVLYLIRKLKIYPKLLVYLSLLLIVISLYWFIERSFEIDLPVDDFIRRVGYKLAVFLGLR